MSGVAVWDNDQPVCGTHLTESCPHRRLDTSLTRQPHALSQVQVGIASHNDLDPRVLRADGTQCGVQRRPKLEAPEHVHPHMRRVE